jgi:hypothetical protein
MKLIQFFTLSLTSLLMFGSIGALSNKAQAQVAKNQGGLAIASRLKAVTKVLSTGAFVKAEQPTQGSIRIISEGGKTYLEIADNFKTSEQGPDLYVILYRTANPPISDIKEKDYTIVGKLRKFSGAQKYEIPANVNIKDFNSAAIWCRKFNATFGYAKLS